MLGLRAESPEPIELKSLQLRDATFFFWEGGLWIVCQHYWEWWGEGVLYLAASRQAKIKWHL